MLKQLVYKIKQWFKPKSKTLRGEFIDLIKSFPSMYVGDFRGDLPSKSAKKEKWDVHLYRYLKEPHHKCFVDFQTGEVVINAENKLALFHKKHTFPLFLRFLKEHNVYNLYEHNRIYSNFLSEKIGDMSLCSCPNDYIVLAFSWMYAPQQIGFWSHLSSEWQQTLYKIYELE